MQRRICSSPAPEEELSAAILFSSILQERPEGGPGADAGEIPRVQTDQGQAPPPGGPHQQTGFLQVHLGFCRITAVIAHGATCRTPL